MIVHHLGIACQNNDKCEQFIENTYNIFKKTGPIYDPNLNAVLSLFYVRGGPAIKVVTGGAVESFLRRNINLYHVCYEVEDLHDEIDRIVVGGAKLLLPPTPALLFDNRLVSFLLTPIGMIELLSKV